MIDFNGTKPIYQEIVSFYKDLIDKGALKPGEIMPSVREVAIEEKINPNTVEKAFTILVKDGYLKNIPKKGFFILKRDVLLNKEERLKTTISARSVGNLSGTTTSTLIRFTGYSYLYISSAKNSARTFSSGSS